MTKKFENRVAKLCYFEESELDLLNKIALERGPDANTIIRLLVKNYLIILDYGNKTNEPTKSKRRGSKQRSN